MSLLFVHSGEKLKEDTSGAYYTDGSYNEAAWRRYLNLSNEVTVMFRKDPQKYSPEEASARFEPFPNDLIVFKEIPDSTSSVGRFLNPFRRRQRRRIIEEEVGHHDAVIVRLPGSAGSEALRIAKRMRKLLLAEIVGCPYDSLRSHSLKGKLLAPFAALRLKRDARSVPFVIYVTSRFLQGRYPTKGRSISCSDVSISSIDTGAFDDRIKQIRQLERRSEMVLGTAAAVDVRYKGQQIVLKALAELRASSSTKFVYRMAGNGDQSRLRSLAKELSIDDRVEFLGPLTHSDMSRFYEGLDIYIQPSFTEGLPRAVIEAMSHGCPVIGTNAGGTPELLEPDFIVRKGDHEALVRQLQSVTPERLERNAERNLESSSQYTRELLDERRTEFLHEAIGRSA